MSSDSENDEISAPLDVLETNNITSMNLLTEMSRKKYEAVYKTFMDWQLLRNVDVDTFSEHVLLAYFEELSEKYKSSSLWSLYSMLKNTLNIHNGINIEHYLKLRKFLKSKSEGYLAKKAQTFTADEINTFIKEAPNKTFLPTKVALIMGIVGACRAKELHAMNIEDIQDFGSAMLVTVPNTKTKVIRTFTITGNFYKICKKYINLRPTNIATTSFFLNYQKGKCNAQKVGINKFGTMGKQMATFLKLPNPEMYTGHSFIKSSTTVFVDAGGNVASLKRQCGWKLSKVAESDKGDSLRSKMDIADKIIKRVGSGRIVGKFKHSEIVPENYRIRIHCFIFGYSDRFL